MHFVLTKISAKRFPTGRCGFWWRKEAGNAGIYGFFSAIIGTVTTMEYY